MNLSRNAFGSWDYSATRFHHETRKCQGELIGAKGTRSVNRRDADTRYYCSVPRSQCLVSLRRGSHPLHGKLLKRHQDFAKITPGDFDFVVGEEQVQAFGILGTNKGRGDEMLKREDVGLAGRRFDSQARGRSLTLPARWRVRDGYFVGFGAVFHVDG
jgi:hypothetical protein